MTEPASKTIGNLNGPWQLLLKVMLVCFVPWSSFITVETILSHNFRSAGPRFTPEDAKLLIAEATGTFDVMETRVLRLELLYDSIERVEAEETEILRQIADTLEQNNRTKP